MMTACVPSHVAAVEVDATEGNDAVGATGGEGDGTTAPAACELPEQTPACDESADPLRALEIGCVDGVSSAEFHSDDDAAWRRTHEFGNAFWVAESSTAVLALSTGRLAELNGALQVTAEVGAAQFASVDNDNPNETSLPDPINPASGSAGSPFVNCDGTGDCSETLPAALDATGLANDLIWFRFEAEVPEGVFGYQVRVAVLTAEYPERVADPVSDMFVWWAGGETFTGNVATLGGEPANVAGLSDLLRNHALGDQMLVRTGFDGGTGSPCSIEGSMAADCPVGATTGWMQLTGSVVPGERLSIAAALVDQGDALLDTVVLLDQWQWRCEGCEPGSSCGLSVVP